MLPLPSGLRAGCLVKEISMDNDVRRVKVGDRVIISRPQSNSRFPKTVDRYACVDAVRPKSFDAGGLCFRLDGREWSGHNRVCLAPTRADTSQSASQADDAEAAHVRSIEREREDVQLAILLSYRHEQEWLKLGLDELHRIAALLGIPAAKAQSPAPRTPTPGHESRLSPFT
jgi:hypothetical protein